MPEYGDERGSTADREAVHDAREVLADAREASYVDRRERARHILADAQERDDQAEVRDAAAMTRDTVADLDSFLHAGEHEYGPALQARRSAALDRGDAHSRCLPRPRRRLPTLQPVQAGQGNTETAPDRPLLRQERWCRSVCLSSGCGVRHPSFLDVKQRRILCGATRRWSGCRSCWF